MEGKMDGTDARPLEKENNQYNAFLNNVCELVDIHRPAQTEELIEAVLSIMETVYSEGPLEFTSYLACMDAISDLRKFSPPFNPEIKIRIKKWIDFFTKKDGPWYMCNTTLCLLAVERFKKLFAALQ